MKNYIGFENKYHSSLSHGQSLDGFLPRRKCDGLFKEIGSFGFRAVTFKGRRFQAICCVVDFSVWSF